MNRCRPTPDGNWRAQGCPLSRQKLDSLARATKWPERIVSCFTSRVISPRSQTELVTGTKGFHRIQISIQSPGMFKAESGFASGREFAVSGLNDRLLAT